MTQVSLNEIVMCPTLPSLPAVAVRLLELTGDPDVAIKDISKLVQQDQAMAAKVLKTVNSSFYGLPQRCGSIDRAMGYLGLNTVKSLVLGFSLVETTKSAGQGFDLETHWRRAILGATAARLLAQKVGGVDPEDAFTASLFQDIGMLAMFVVLKDQYTSIISGVRHGVLSNQERDKLGFDHARVGSELAARWKLPAGIVDAIEYHHSPEHCETEHQSLACVVSLGAQVCACLESDAPSSSIRTYERLSRKWYGNAAPEAEQLLEDVGETGKTLAKMFGQDIGEMPNTGEIIAQAQEQNTVHQLSMQRHTDELAREVHIDGLTQIANRKQFDAEIARVYNGFVSDGDHFGVLFFDADRFKSVNDTFGHAAGDLVLIELAKRTSEVVGEDGTVFRYGGEEFAVIVESTDFAACGKLAERVRSAIASQPFSLSGVEGAPDTLNVTVSIGVSSSDASDPSRLISAEHVVHEADECVYVAKSDGRNNVKVFGQFEKVTIIDSGKASSEPAIAPPVQLGEKTKQNKSAKILLVEDDSLAATLMISLLKRRDLVEIEWVKSGTRACTLIEAGKFEDGHALQLIVCDFNLPGCNGHEVLKNAREHASTRHVPFFMLTGDNDQHMRDECIRRGVTKFIHKDEFCTDINRWLGTMIDASKHAA